ncbi:H-2 class I histocompatibility antigen, Q10 alpha chain-like isoform X2 [Hemibagrus wyckioides]|uniref:H-2 class I histocompatibility antigen, Q10 alpha chain-like isoform X2 n=2 Tax=Hemibagrus wyckioides TaxID=337641 RepID=UPI00266BA266|nr:H-2 class I histocompatibility antigen, Q10 alpha chain-like isoform X2 [Hemibagrus wyckioides]
MEDSSIIIKVLHFCTVCLFLPSAVASICLLILCVCALGGLIHSVVTHTLLYLYTAVRSGINFSEFSAVGLMDGEQCVYYDSNITKMIPKTEWMQKISTDDPDYWNRETQRMRHRQDQFQDTVAACVCVCVCVGVHTLQRMYGCELYDDGTTRGYDQYAYDGEDFISLNLTTGTWTAAKPQAVMFIKVWDPKGAKAQYWQSYLKSDCIDQLRKFVSYSRETLERKVPPTASVFQKHSPSPEVVCHATGFFPKAVNITWRKDGEDVNEDVELRETLPNQDGSFQKRSILKVPAEDLQKHTYTCVIQHSSLKEELVLYVNEQQITKDGGSGGWKTGVVVPVVVVAVLVAVVAGVFIWIKKKGSGVQSPQVQTGAELHPLNTPHSDVPV